MFDASHCWRDQHRDEPVIRFHRPDLKDGLENNPNDTKIWRV